MFRQAAIVVFVALLATVALSSTILKPKCSVSSVRTMKDQALQQLALLRSSVNGYIKQAENNLNDLQQQTINYEGDVSTTFERKINDEVQRLLDNYNVIKNLAESSGINIGTCTIFEDRLRALSPGVIDELRTCLTGQLTELSSIIDKAKANVLAISNEVDGFETELEACGDNDVNCISPVVKEIEDAQQEFPSQIEIEVSRVQPVIDSLRASIDQCGDSKLADCTTRGNKILNDFQVCVGNLKLFKKEKKSKVLN